MTRHMAPRVRLTTAELHAALDAITAMTAGDADGWSDARWAALERAEDKIRRMLHARRDYDHDHEMD